MRKQKTSIIAYAPPKGWGMHRAQTPEVRHDLMLLRINYTGFPCECQAVLKSSPLPKNSEAPIRKQPSFVLGGQKGLITPVMFRKDTGM
jgi:hypothetical protein